MAWSANANRGWAKGATLPGSPPFNPDTTTTAKPPIVTKPPVVKPTLPTTDAPLPSAPTHPYGANYVPRTNGHGYSASGGAGFQFNGRRPPRDTSEVVPPPPGGNQPPPGGAPPPPTPPPGAGGMNPDGTWRAPDQAYLDGLRNGTIAPQWAGQPGSPEYQNWLNSDQRRDRIAAAQNQPPPGGQPPPGTPPPAGQPRPPRPPRPNRPGQPGQIPQQAAQALYNDNTIPHDFKGQLMELARGGNAQAFNEALFNSALPQETKLRLQQLFRFGSPAPAAPAPVSQPQGVPQPPPAQPQGAVAPPPPQGSPYYGAY